MSQIVESFLFEEYGNEREDKNIVSISKDSFRPNLSTLGLVERKFTFPARRQKPVQIFFFIF